MLAGQNLQEATWVTPTTGGTRAPRNSLTCCHHGLPWASGPLASSSAPGPRFPHVGTRAGREGPQRFFSTETRAVSLPGSAAPTQPALGQLCAAQPWCPRCLLQGLGAAPRNSQISPSPWGLARLLAAPPLPQVPATPAGHSPSSEDALGGVC